MSPAATMSQPSLPPRPARSTDNASPGSMPLIPPRPASKRNDRSVSPNPERFAQSPFSEGLISKPPKSGGHMSHLHATTSHDDLPDRPASRGMPSVGEEGFEYDNIGNDYEQAKAPTTRALSPEQTRTIGEDIKLHAPKPSLPAQSAKQRVQAVTRTDSDRAAQYGLGRPSSRSSRPSSMHEERTASNQELKKKASSSFSVHSDKDGGDLDEHGIPQFGHRVPMNPHLGDVQAPSPAPGADSPGRHHHRKGSSRSLPPGSYGMHGHGVHAQDKLEKAYYMKHPELLEKEHHNPIHDRQNDFAMSSSDLNKLVRETAHRGHGTTPEYQSTPTDEVAFQATDEYASRISSPRPASAAPPKDHAVTSPLKQSFQPDITESKSEDTIHVDDPRHPEYRSYGDEAVVEDENEYSAPILAEDEVQKDPNAYNQRPAIHLSSERRRSSAEADDNVRPTSRPSSLYATLSHDHHNHTPLEDVEEYEPLFTDEVAKAKEAQKRADAKNRQHHFPSKDIWEDAPNSVHFTATVSTPDLLEPKRRRSSAFDQDRPHTPAQAFAQHQEELAEREARSGHRPEDWNPHEEHRPPRGSGSSQRPGSKTRSAHAFAQHQEELAEKEARGGRRPEDWHNDGRSSWADGVHPIRTHRTGGSGRFPSRDVWEDTPESAMHQATLSGSPPKETSSKPEAPVIPARPTKTLSGSSADRPSIPERPKPRQGSGDDKVPPPVSDKPKPQVPNRPSKSLSGDSAGEPATKTKPPVPSRPVGGKIAALQAGFMNDLNQRLKIGPQIQTKKEEAPEEDTSPVAEKEKAPLSDARKGRARGPQRRAPAKSPAPATAAPTQQPIPTFTFTMAGTSWSIDPDVGDIDVPSETKDVEEPVEATSEEPAQAKVEAPAEAPASEPQDEPALEQEQTFEYEEKLTTKASLPTTDAEVETAPETAEEAERVQQSEAPQTEAGQTEQSEPTTSHTEEAPLEQKTLVANTAGESVLETTIEKKEGGNEVEPVAVEDTPKDI